MLVPLPLHLDCINDIIVTKILKSVKKSIYFIGVILEFYEIAPQTAMDSNKEKIMIAFLKIALLFLITIHHNPINNFILRPLSHL